MARAIRRALPLQLAGQVRDLAPASAIRSSEVSTRLRIAAM
jgi:hypothetical protein